MKIPDQVTQTYLLSPALLEEAIKQYLEIMPKDDGKISFSWKHGSRLEGQGSMEMDVPYFDGVEVTYRPSKYILQ